MAKELASESSAVKLTQDAEVRKEVKSDEVNLKPEATTQKSKRTYNYKDKEKYKCAVCGKGFPNPQSLNMHFNTKHPEVK